jgi:O-antigen biosynthesis protein WbqP
VRGVLVFKRLIDLTFVLIAAVFALPLAFLVAMAVKLTSQGPALYWSDRLGQNNQIFKMPKFRSMKIGTPAKASHELRDAISWLTPIGGFLRRTSMDEVPQLWSIFVGHMSVVGPRPALFNQDDLISMRTLKGVHRLKPGLTGWAQVNGRDELSIADKVALDEYYLQNRSALFDFKIMLKTIIKVLRQSGITH